MFSVRDDAETRSYVIEARSSQAVDDVVVIARAATSEVAAELAAFYNGLAQYRPGYGFNRSRAPQ